MASHIPVLRKKAETKRIKSGFRCSTDEVSVELSNTEDCLRDNICRMLSLSDWLQVQVRQSSLLPDIHEKVYDNIQREVSKKKLDSLTNAAAVHESHRLKLVDERDEVFYTDLVATR